MQLNLNYNEFLEKIGSKYDIVNGVLVESDTGVLTVSKNFEQYTIYLNTLSKSVSLIIPEKAYIGRFYLLKKSDCIKLVNEWLDDKLKTTNYLERYKNTDNRTFKKYYSEGVKHAYLDNSFVEVDSQSVSVNDVIVYGNKNHVAVCVDTNRILHHMPGKLSCYDQLDTEKILGVYRP